MRKSVKTQLYNVKTQLYSVKTQSYNVKTQFYSANGAGRDSYIYGTNGGFCPQKEPCKIEDLGKLLFSLKRGLSAFEKQR